MKIIKKFIFLLLIINIFVISGFTTTKYPNQVAPSESETLSIPYRDYINFLNTLKPDQIPSGAVLGIYIPEKFAFPVQQQPTGHPEFVSNEEDTLTQFSLVSAKNAYGLLAHNHLAGQYFSDLETGQFILVVMKEETKVFQINQILDYQALTPNSPYSNFKALDGSDQVINTNTLFSNIYTKDNQLVLQTCISLEDEMSWGRKFVIAEEIEVGSISEYFDYGFKYSFSGNR